MSRIGIKPITIPAGVSVSLSDDMLAVKGPKGELSQKIITKLVKLETQDEVVKITKLKESKHAAAMWGTTRALVNNMVLGVSDGFEKKLTLIGVGYRAKLQGNKLNLTLGFSHPVEHELPKGVIAETPSQTEIVLKSIDKCLLGQVAAEIRAYRPPEPYKGKGIRYVDEYVARKDAKKK